jgi:hypothetical protein
LSSIWLNWLNRFHSLPSRKREEKKKTVKRQRPHGLLHICPLPEQKPSNVLSLFIKSIYASQNI